LLEEVEGRRILIIMVEVGKGIYTGKRRERAVRDLDEAVAGAW